MASTERKTITAVEVDRKNQSGVDHPRLRVKDQDNTWYSIWDVALWPRFSEGAALNVEVKTNDKGYKQISSVLGTAASPNGHAPSGGGSDRERSIQRQVALKAATDLVLSITPTAANIDNSPDIARLGDWTITLATRFAEWLSRTEEEEDAPF